MTLSYLHASLLVGFKLLLLIYELHYFRVRNKKLSLKKAGFICSREGLLVGQHKIRKYLDQNGLAGVALQADIYLPV